MLPNVTLLTFNFEILPGLVLHINYIMNVVTKTARSVQS